MSFELPELPLTADAIPDHEELPDESGGCRSYAFIGSGQGGGRLAESFYKLGYKKTLVCNTAPQDLKSLSIIPEDQKILLDAGVSGAGKDMRVGEEAMLKGQHRLYESMLRKFGKVDHILICVGAGGGSGGGSSLVLLETATKYMKYIGLDDAERRVGFIVTLPTNGECASPGVGTNSKFLIEELAKYAQGGQLSPLVVVDNDKIKRLFHSQGVLGQGQRYGRRALPYLQHPADQGDELHRLRRRRLCIVDAGRWLHDHGFNYCQGVQASRCYRECYSH